MGQVVLVEVSGAPVASQAAPRLVKGAGSRVEAIDGLRAVAACMVYFFHAWKNSYESTPSGGAAAFFSWGMNTLPLGVDLFMVISGFCLFWPTARQGRKFEWRQWSMGEYFRRRVRRIVPPYYLSLVFVTLLPNALVLAYRAVGQEAKWQVMPEWWQYVAHLTFTHTWFPATWSGIQGVYWSLGLEAQFYVVFPLVIWAFGRVGMKAVWGIIALSMAFSIGARIATHVGPGDSAARQNALETARWLLSITFLGRWMEFGAGMLAAWMVARRRETREIGAGAGTGMILLAAAMFAAVNVPAEWTGWWAWACEWLPTHEVVCSAVFGLAIVALCGSGTVFRKVFEFRPLTALGFMSFSLFLVHQNLAFYIAQGLQKVLHLSENGTFLFMATAGLAIVSAVAYGFFLVCERPFMNVSRARKPVAVAAGVGIVESA